MWTCMCDAPDLSNSKSVKDERSQREYTEQRKKERKRRKNQKRERDDCVERERYVEPKFLQSIKTDTSNLYIRQNHEKKTDKGYKNIFHVHPELYLKLRNENKKLP